MKTHYCQNMPIIFLTVFMLLWSAAGFAAEKPNQAGGITSVVTTRTARTVTYYKDQRITVPLKINRIAVGWPAQNSVVAMLGYGDKIVATHELIKANPMFVKFVPSIDQAVGCFSTSGEVNIEAIVQAKPDVVFSPSAGANGDQIRRLSEMGIAVAGMKANSLDNLVERTVITGRILGDDAYRQALKYVDYFDGNVKKVTARIACIPAGKRVKVYHCLSTPLSTTGAPSLNQDWMDKAGVINVARNWGLANLGQGSNNANTNMEQIIGADPDVIVCMNARDATFIKTDPSWRMIKAVKEGKVYTNPKGLFWWCRETTEEALQFLWLAKTVYPALFKDVDMVRETRYFYKTFYRLDLTDKEVQIFLAGS